jgi:hydrogenase maturation protein HypF
MALLAGEQHARLRVSPVASGRERVSRRIVLSGHVQGVGFRPFVFRQATELGLRGTVRNNTGTVEIIVQGKSEALVHFTSSRRIRRPQASQPLP